jgi:protein dithiol oxidoreductase (disulfide-forming)
MKKIVAIAGLLLVVTVACGKQPENTDETAAAPPAAPAPAQTQDPMAPSPAATPADGDQIEAGEALDTEAEETDTEITSRANLQLAQAVAPPQSQADSRWKQGVHYQLLVPAQPTNVSPGKVEVVEVFWYGCGHCRDLEPFIKSYNQKKPAYVQFARLPVTWSAGHTAQARLYYTLAALGKSEDLQDAVFTEMQTNRNPLVGNDAAETERVQAAFAKKHGIDEKAFREAYRSMGVMTRVRRAEELVRRYQASSVPMMVVNGKYTTDVSMAGGHNQLIALVSDLAAREQK